MPLFEIEWGIHDKMLIRDVIEADDIKAAIRKADEMAEDLWESNKIASARPFRDKTIDAKPTRDTVPGDGVGHDMHASGRGAGGGE